MSRLKAYFLLLSAFCLAQTALAPVFGQKPFDDFAERIESERKRWGAPGLAIAVVHNDRVVLAQGFGVRDLSTGEPVDEHTLFHVGSTTKAFTVAALALHVQEGRLSWNDKVISHLPEFRVADPYVTRELTIVDLLTHRSGVEGTDFLWATGLPADQFLERLVHAEQSSSLRSRFEYNNGMYLIAGQLAGAIAGTSYEEFVRDRLFRPLGMERTTGPLHEIAQRSNVATSHARIAGEMRPIGLTDQYEAGGAGLFYSSVAEYSSWLRMWLNEGKLGGKVILEPESVRMAFTPQMAIAESLYPATSEAGVDLISYGLGWFLHEYRGRRVNMHTGSISGMSAIVGLMPEEKVGMVAFINADHIELRHALMYEAFDRAIGGEQRDWSGDLHEFYTSITKKSQERRKERMANFDESASAALPLEEYAGLYRHPLMGELTVSLNKEGLRLQGWRLFELDLRSVGEHRFLGYPIRRGFEDARDELKYGNPSLIQFEIGSDNRPRRLLLGKAFERQEDGR